MPPPTPAPRAQGSHDPPLPETSGSYEIALSPVDNLLESVYVVNVKVTSSDQIVLLESKSCGVSCFFAINLSI